MLSPEIHNPDFVFTPQGKISFVICVLIVILNNIHESGILGTIASLIAIAGGIVVLGLNIDRWLYFRKQKNKDNEK
jgi:hypothetical protein